MSRQCSDHSSDAARHAWQILSILFQQGVRDLVITSGSRNAPLIFAADQLRMLDPEVRLFSHFDERGAAFFALGICKSRSRPVVVVTTSGSAVANLHPATVEAKQNRLPLILLTADRPDELLNCGANQAIEQPGSLRPHVIGECHWSADLGPDSEWLIVDQLRELLGRARSANGGPIHINCQFREPLYELLLPDLYQLPVADDVTPFRTDTLPVRPWTASANTVLLAAQLTQPEAEALLEFSEKRNLPILADIGSQLRLTRHPNLIVPIDGVLESDAGRGLLSETRSVVQFGGRLVSKPLQQWLDRFDGDYQLYSRGPDPLDPGHHSVQRQAEIPELIAHWLDRPGESNPCWLERWQGIGDQLCELITQSGSGWNSLHIVKTLSELLPVSMALFAGNSLAIRLLDKVSVTRFENSSPLYSSRGASGIDGLLATALGCQQYHDGLCLLLGDLSLLHDLNSLALTRYCRKPMVIVLLNDGGGGIFNLLPAKSNPDLHREFFQVVHRLRFEQVAAMFSLEYRQPDTLEDFQRGFRSALEYPRATLIECCVDAQLTLTALCNLQNRFHQIRLER